MKKTRFGMGSALILMIGILVIGMGGCAGVQVSQDYDAATDFSMLKTFSWADAAQPLTGDVRIDNPLQNTRIRSAVERVLESRGFLKVAANASPSFQVRYHHTLRSRVNSGSGIGFGIGLGGFGRRTGGGVALGTGDSVDTYDEAQLVIDIVDNQTDVLFWRGTGTYRFAEYQDPVHADAAIDGLVDKIMAPFPPKKPG